MQRVKEDAQKKVQQVEDLLNRRIFHLEEASPGAPRTVSPRSGLTVEWAESCSFFHKLAGFQQKCEPPVFSASWGPALSQALRIWNSRPDTLRPGRCVYSTDGDSQVQEA